MSIGERVLLLLSRKPGTKEYPGTEAHEEWNLDNSLSFLCQFFPNFLNEIEGKEILDFGCGLGWQVVGMAMNGAKFVVGLDVNPVWRQEAQELANNVGVSERVEFAESLENRFKGRFDMVTSQSSFEHFTDPVAALEEMKTALNPEGRVFLTFYGPWLSPRV